MTTTATATAPAHHPQGLMRRTAFLGGALYLLTFLSSIPAALLTRPVLDPTNALGAGLDDRIVVAGVLDIVNALACIGTAVVLFPVVKRQSETLALGFVTTRVLEASLLFTAVVSTLTIVTLRQDGALRIGSGSDAVLAVAAGLIAVHDWAFLLGTGMAIANALLLGTLMYRSRLVPRVIPLMGLIGAPLLLAANLLTMFGLNDQFGLMSVIALPGIFFWELSLGVDLVVKCFKPTPVLTTPLPATLVTDGARCGHTPMRAVVHRRLGLPEVAHVQDVPESGIGVGDALIHALTSAISAAGRRTRSLDVPPRLQLPGVLGVRRPRHPVLGQDVTDAITAVGATLTRVTATAAGDDAAPSSHA